jgi:hypothetical protein
MFCLLCVDCLCISLLLSRRQQQGQAMVGPKQLQGVPRPDAASNYFVLSKASGAGLRFELCWQHRQCAGLHNRAGAGHIGAVEAGKVACAVHICHAHV